MFNKLNEIVINLQDILYYVWLLYHLKKIQEIVMSMAEEINQIFCLTNFLLTIVVCCKPKSGQYTFRWVNSHENTNNYKELTVVEACNFN